MVISAEIQYEISFKRYLLEKYDMYHIHSKSKLYNLMLILRLNSVRYSI